MENASKFYIDGKWVQPVSTKTSELIDPATEKVYGTIAMGSAEDVDNAVKAARRAFTTFSQSTVGERVALLEKIDRIFRRREREIAETVTQEMGMPISLSTTGLADWCKVHTAATIEILRNFEFVEKLGTTTVYKEPIGVVGLITPWNWPIGQIFTKILPAIATGCTMVLKPSQLTPLDAVILAEIMDEAGVPPGVFNLVNGDGRIVGEAISRHPGIDMVSFTGSTRAGIQISKSAADTVKRVVNELGGKSANIILDDADFNTALLSGFAVCYHAGQGCAITTRLLLPKSRYEEGVQFLQHALPQLPYGDPRGEGQIMGPLISARQQARVLDYIEIGKREGARLVCGGGKPKHLPNGFYVEPTLFADVRNDMRIAQEEIFGPVLVAIPYEDDEDAIRIANDSAYGLSGGVWSGDLDRAEAVARRMHTGQVILNGAGLDLAAPFGGVKQSGLGRENGRYGLEEYCSPKAITRPQA